ncbi:hypothetical protein AFLA_011144 [Aspergillus flavus NRRL3357]|nr:hypothetical protein AFLA_011144 [Aspergillus flavus NRRL3357]
MAVVRPQADPSISEESQTESLNFENLPAINPSTQWTAPSSRSIPLWTASVRQANTPFTSRKIYRCEIKAAIQNRTASIHIESTALDLCSIVEPGWSTGCKA